MSVVTESGPPRVSPLYNPRVRSIAYQIALCVLIGFLIYAAATNAIENLARARIASGFGFWNVTAGFDISQTLIYYSAQASTYGQAFWVGLLNTLLVAGLGVILATILGFLVGVARLSRNFLVSRIAASYVELIRNLPLLLQLLFWYNAVLKALPDLRDSLTIGTSVFLNNRGLFLPSPDFRPGADWAFWAFVVGVAGAIAFRIWAARRQERTGQQAPVFLVWLALIVGLPLVVFLAAGLPVEFSYPEKGRFNIRGGVEILPEFVALLFGLVVYTAAFIAEVVRAGILSVSRGQTEAAAAVGLRSGSILRLVVVPQAMRVIIPPLTNQYLNLTKNSSLAVAIGYPDLVQVFTGTVLNQTGQAVEVVLITMGVYLTISLVTSLAMNVYNARIALVER
ncbi:MAG: ral L-amino acid transport system permease protein [Variibacter sp.]|jgi:general L-amino acid transport system permease protein|nr:ral L-amino acid transport system permease protein [Variibacter sp.]